ncbi:MAG: hypothetical protein M3478_02360 [Planctomycetota bacterium]|nr:hypothetical protein [Planctomycetota bacterium]
MTNPANDLPTDPDAFYRAGPDIDALQPPSLDAPPALQRLGAAPFPKGKFPFLGFLATVYEHVAAHAQGRVK